ncbi:PREDICTED: E3 ubiquitin/ISG15 ligase TRIM25-like [Nanorana parkeri]|uniref:E3 ubiquitin/ISG15 ligase TRIM25-like n=1 Tax=Nanorana parkeri TaxID=125878 RepID=UPI000854AC8C|nr:PREDICTED: E3 ubiquitin/ISG15 ligase TRIM25-like [Nanorana parkeri]
MASAVLRKELECSVCLNTYTDPVTLRCGHNFCRDCIDLMLDTQGRSGGYSCPECREKFQERSTLQRNITLRNIVENFLSAQPDQEESGIFCTYCIHTPVPAVKSCLMCEASLCDNHLRVHSKSPEHARRPNIGAAQQTSGVSGVTDILLDVNTAGNRLLISDDRKSATWSYKNHNRPETPERFQDCPQVLSSQSFSSGRHYWEVDVKRSKSWIVGMCYPSIERRGPQSEIGCNKKSWGLERSHIQYSVIHDSDEIRLPGIVSSNRVRIDLDYEAGRISFYDLCDPIRLLHTFTTTFTEPLHAGVFVGRGCIKISGGNQM